MIVPEENRPSKSQETRNGLFFTFATLVSICVGLALAHWLGGIFHNYWVIVIGFVGGMLLSGVVANKVGKVFGVDFSDILSSEYRY
jgi:hypothetical protein